MFVRDPSKHKVAKTFGKVGKDLSSVNTVNTQTFIIISGVREIKPCHCEPISCSEKTPHSSEKTRRHSICLIALGEKLFVVRTSGVPSTTGWVYLKR